MLFGLKKVILGCSGLCCHSNDAVQLDKTVYSNG